MCETFNTGGEVTTCFILVFICGEPLMIYLLLSTSMDGPLLKYMHGFRMNAERPGKVCKWNACITCIYILLMQHGI